MQILGIDVGTTPQNPTGWAIVDTDDDAILGYGLLKPASADGHLPDLIRQLQRLLRESTPAELAHVAIETPFVGLNGRTSMVLAQMFGGYLAVCTLAGLRVIGVTPSRAKAALFGHGGALKSQMQYAVKVRYNLAVPSHIADAIAVALASQEQVAAAP